MKKIFYLSRAKLPSDKTHSLSIMKVCQAFADAGYNVLLSGQAPAPDSPDPILYYGLDGGFHVVTNRLESWLDNPFIRLFKLDSLVMAIRNRDLIKAFDPDIVYSRLTLLQMAFVPRDKPIIYETHSLGSLSKTRWHKLLFSYLVKYRNLKKIVVTTEFLAEEIRQLFPTAQVVLAPLSAEPPVDIAQDEIATFRRQNLQGEQFDHHVGYTGNLDTTGLRGIQIICQLAGQMPGVAFHVVGGKPDDVTYWKSYIEALPQHHNNIYFYGYRNPNDIPYFLYLFDVVLAPLQYRPTLQAPLGQGMSPLKIAQYMAYSKAIVASNIPAHREILHDGTTALLVRHDDIDEWASAIQRVLTDDELRRTVAQNAQQIYFSQFTPDKRIARIMDGL
jgi:glycosyltransferase involved in cell wall biosynthesis